MDDKLGQEFPLVRGGDDDQRTTYLDHAGAGLYSKSQIEAISRDLLSSVHLSPHTSSQALEEIRSARRQVLEFFVADEEDYAVIFTSGATASIRIVGDGVFSSFRGDSYSLLCYSRESHTSVVGLRQLASKTKVLSKEQLLNGAGDDDGEGRKLVAFPAMSNFCGEKFPVDEIVKTYHDKGFLVLLDAAAFASTNPLSLSEVGRPDFVCVSFYKLFGYPTGLGALLARRDSLKILAEGKTYFGGGTVEMHLVDKPRHQPRTAFPEEYFEDGTLPFLQISSLKHGFSALFSIGGGMESISRRTLSLAAALHSKLSSLRHSNGNPLAETYSRGDYSDPSSQGAIVTFNLLKPDGTHFGFNAFRRVAEEERVVVRTGCFCNVGACQGYLGFGDADTLRNFESGHVCGDDVDVIRGRPVGAIRASVGYYNTMEDVEKVLHIVETHFLNCANLPATITNGHSDNEKAMARVHQLCFYPVKSCAPMVVPSGADWPAGETGMSFDRRWAVMDSRTGQCLNQKKLRSLCLVSPEVDPAKGTITLRYPKMEPLVLPLDGSPVENGVDVASPCVSGRVCNEKMEGVDCGEAAAEWMAEATGREGARLVRQSDTDERLNSSKLTLANSAPYLVLNRASVSEVSRRMRAEFGDSEPEETFDVERLLAQFRGNIVLDGGEPFEEDFWETITVPGEGGKKELVLQRHEACMRCGMIAIDQSSGEEVRGLSRTLAYMTDRGFKFGILFGLPKESSSPHPVRIRVGDFATVKKSAKNLSSS